MTLILPQRGRLSVGAGTAVASLTFVDSDSTFDGGSTISGTYSFGTAHANRILVVCVGAFDTGGTNWTTATIGGVSATAVGTAEINGNIRVHMYYAAVPTGTSGTVAVSNTASMQDGGMGLYSIIGNVPLTLLDNAKTTSTAPTSVDVDVSEIGQAIIGLALNQNGSSHTWTNVTEDIDVDIRSDEWFSTASKISDTIDATYTVTVGTDLERMKAAVFGAA